MNLPACYRGIRGAAGYFGEKFSAFTRNSTRETPIFSLCPMLSNVTSIQILSNDGRMFRNPSEKGRKANKQSVAEE